MPPDPSQRPLVAALARSTDAFNAPPRRQVGWVRRLVAALARYTDAEMAAALSAQHHPGQPSRGTTRPGRSELSKHPDRWQQPLANPSPGSDPAIHVQGTLPDEVHGTDPTERTDATAPSQMAAISALRVRAEAGDVSAANALADALAEHGRIDDAVAVLREQADVGNPAAAERLVEVLLEHQSSDQAIDFLRGRADAGDESAAELLTALLALQSFVDDDAVNLLRARADAGDKHATDMLPRLLVERRRLDDAVSFLRSRVDAGDERAAELLALLLAELNAAEDANTMPRQAGSTRPTPSPTTHGPSTSFQSEEPAEEPELPWSGGETVRPVQGRSGTALLIVAPERVARVTRSAILYRQGSTTVTVAYFDSEEHRFPLQELDQIERVEHGGLLGPRLFELWALFRGHRVRLFHTYDAREFGQVCRALTRAREYSGLA